jgi:hypothetical protein
MNLETLISIEEIRQLMARYARYADAKRWDSLAGLFTPDGTFVSHAVDGGVVADMKGRQDIEETLAAVTAGDVVPIHLLLSSEVEPSGSDQAHAIYAMADLIYRDEVRPEGQGANLPDFRVMRGWGHYNADFVRVDGEWRIRSLVQTRTRLEFE